MSLNQASFTLRSFIHLRLFLIAWRLKNRKALEKRLAIRIPMDTMMPGQNSKIQGNQSCSGYFGLSNSERSSVLWENGTLFSSILHSCLLFPRVFVWSVTWKLDVPNETGRARRFSVALFCKTEPAQWTWMSTGVNVPDRGQCAQKGSTCLIGVNMPDIPGPFINRFRIYHRLPAISLQLKCGRHWDKRWTWGKFHRTPS